MGKKTELSDRYKTALRRGKILELVLENGSGDWRGKAAEVKEWAEAEGLDLPNGFDERYAYKDFLRELEHTRNYNLANVEEIRLVETARLDMIWRHLFDMFKACKDLRESGYLADRLLKVMNRRAKMHGLDMPILMKWIEEVDFNTLPDEVLERIASGEDVELVLADHMRREKSYD